MQTDSEVCRPFIAFKFTLSIMTYAMLVLQNNLFRKINKNRMDFVV